MTKEIILKDVDKLITDLAEFIIVHDFRNTEVAVLFEVTGELYKQLDKQIQEEIK